MIDAVIDGRTYHFDDEEESSIVGHGGEADVFRFNPYPEFEQRHGHGQYVVKIFREDTEIERRAADARQTKLRHFPAGLPSNVVKPVTLAEDRSGRVIGYVMAFVPNAKPLIEFKAPAFRKANRVTHARICRILANLHDLVVELHAMGIVIGDFNDKNVVVLPDNRVFLLDADSLQYGEWECPAYVPGFVDPTICAPADPADLKSLNQLRKTGQHSQLTDWYAFTVMAFQLFVLTHPYTGGVHHPGKNGGKKRKGQQRIHLRLSVFDPKIGLPPTVVPFKNLPENLLRLFHIVFVEEKRGQFPKVLLDPATWIECSRCRTEHGHEQCPNCSAPGIAPRQRTAPAAARTTRRPATPAAPYRPVPPAPRTAQPQARPSTTSTILAAAHQDGRLRLVLHGSGAYRREDGTEIWRQPYDSRMQAHVAGNRAVLSAGTSFALFNGHKPPQRYETQTVNGKTTVAANSRQVYWVSGSSLMCNTAGSENQTTIGMVAPHMTQVWVGERFGVVLIQAGVLTRIKTFDTNRVGLHSSLQLEPEFGTVVDTQCVINNDFAWIKVTSQAPSGQTTHRCYVIDSHARLRATGDAQQGRTPWLDAMTSTSLPLADKLIVPTRHGFVRVRIWNEQLHEERTYSAPAEVLDKETTVGLIASPGGILHVGKHRQTPISL